MQDLRTKQIGLPITLLAQNFNFIICGDDEETIHNFSSTLTQLNIEHQIQFITDKKDCPQALGSLEKLVVITTRIKLIDTENPSILFLAFKKEEAVENYRQLLRESKNIYIHLTSEFIQGNAALPLSFTQDGLEISVHSNGRIDRKARALSNYISRQIEKLTDVTLLVLGTDHQFLNLEEREPYHLQSPKYETIASQLSLIAGIQEFFILNTCNRIEVYAMASRNDTTIQVIRRLLNFDHLREDQYYIKYDRNAFSHMCLVLCGLLSQVPGETHVVQQMKKAVEGAKYNKWAGGLLQQVFDNALFVSKNTRQKTSPHLSKLEIEDLSTLYAQEGSHHLENKSIVVLGSGVVGLGLIDRILTHRPKDITIVYRTHKPDLAKYASNVSAVSSQQLSQALEKADTIFSAVSTSRFVIHSAHIHSFKKNSPVLIVDICVPRSVDNTILKDCANLQIADIESIKHWYLHINKDIETVRNIGYNEIITRTGRYEKILDKEWLQEQ